jgi:hypothetical protein
MLLEAIEAALQVAATELREARETIASLQQAGPRNEVSRRDSKPLVRQSSSRLEIVNYVFSQCQTDQSSCGDTHIPALDKYNFIRC